MPFTFFWNRKKIALKKEMNELNQEIVSLKEQFNEDRTLLEEKHRKSEEELQAKQLQLKQAFQSVEEEQTSKALLKQDLDLKNATLEDLKEQLEEFVQKRTLQNSLLTKYKQENGQLLLSNDVMMKSYVKKQLILKKNKELSDDKKMKSLEERLVSERHRHEKQMKELQEKMEHQGQILKERENQLQFLVQRLQKERKTANDERMKEKEEVLSMYKKQMEELQKKMEHQGQILKERDDKLQEKQITIARLTKVLERQKCLNQRLLRERETANDGRMKEKEEALRLYKLLAAEIEEKETSLETVLQMTEDHKSHLQDYELMKEKEESLRIYKELTTEIEEKQTTIAQLTKELEEQRCLNQRFWFLESCPQSTLKRSKF